MASNFAIPSAPADDLNSTTTIISPTSTSSEVIVNDTGTTSINHETIMNDNTMSTNTATKDTSSNTNMAEDTISKDITIKNSALAQSDSSTALFDEVIFMSDQSQSPLTALPPELRTIIWEFLLEVPTKDQNGVLMVFTTSKPGASHTTQQNSPIPSRKTSILSLLGTCRAIHTEALPMFYTLNRLRFCNPFVSGRIGHVRAGCIARLTFGLPHPVLIEQYTKAMRHLTGLKALRFMGSSRRYGRTLDDMSNFSMSLSGLCGLVRGLERLEKVEVFVKEGSSVVMIKDPQWSELLMDVVLSKTAKQTD